MADVFLLFFFVFFFCIFKDVHKNECVAYLVRLEIRRFLKFLSDMFQPSEELFFHTRTALSDKHFEHRLDGITGLHRFQIANGRFALELQLSQKKINLENSSLKKNQKINTIS